MKFKSIYGGVIDVGNFDFEKTIRIEIVPTDNPKKQNVTDCVRWLNVDQVIELRDCLTTQIISQKQNEGEMRETKKNSTSEIIKLLSECTGKQSVQLLQSDYGNILFHLETIIAERDKLISDKHALSELLKAKHDECDKLKGENKRWSEQFKRVKRVILLTPNTSDNEPFFHSLQVLESFIKTALTKNRESGKWYAARYTKFANPVLQPCYCIGDGNWAIAGVEDFVNESELCDISTTPINLGE